MTKINHKMPYNLSGVVPNILFIICRYLTEMIPMFNRNPLVATAEMHCHPQFVVMRMEPCLFALSRMIP